MTLPWIGLCMYSSTTRVPYPRTTAVVFSIVLEQLLAYHSVGTHAVLAAKLVGFGSTGGTANRIAKSQNRISMPVFYPRISTSIHCSVDANRLECRGVTACNSSGNAVASASCHKQSWVLPPPSSTRFVCKEKTIQKHCPDFSASSGGLHHINQPTHMHITAKAATRWFSLYTNLYERCAPAASLQLTVKRNAVKRHVSV